MRVVLQVTLWLRKGVGLHYTPVDRKTREFPKKSEARLSKKVIFEVQLRKSC